MGDYDNIFFNSVKLRWGSNFDIEQTRKFETAQDIFVHLDHFLVGDNHSDRALDQLLEGYTLRKQHPASLRVHPTLSFSHFEAKAA